MTAELILQPSPEAAALLLQRERLAALRATLAQRESELAQIRAALKIFESRYLREVGILYAQLDDLEARIAEREVDLYDSEPARRRAREARARAQETHDAALSGDLEPEEFDPPPSLKTLFRELARRIHPDFATDESDRNHLTLLMIRANQAYTRGDAETLQRLLDDHHEIDASEGPGHERLRLERQLHHAQRDLDALAAEQKLLEESEIGRLHLDAQTAPGDLLAELAARLQTQIADAQYRFDFIDKVIDRQT